MERKKKGGTKRDGERDYTLGETNGGGGGGGGVFLGGVGAEKRKKGELKTDGKEIYTQTQPSSTARVRWEGGMLLILLRVEPKRVTTLIK